MEETVNQEVTAVEKTFTQSELDSIVADRLRRERSKYEGFDEIKAKADKLDEIEAANKTELEKVTERATALESELNAMKKAASIREIREKVSAETGIPAKLLTAENEDDCRAQAEAIKDFAKPAPYPQLKDGGEIVVMDGSPRQHFAEWASQAFS